MRSNREMTESYLSSRMSAGQAKRVLHLFEMAVGRLAMGYGQGTDFKSRVTGKWDKRKMRTLLNDWFVHVATLSGTHDVITDLRIATDDVEGDVVAGPVDEVNHKPPNVFEGGAGIEASQNYLGRLVCSWEGWGGVERERTIATNGMGSGWIVGVVVFDDDCKYVLCGEMRLGIREEGSRWRVERSGWVGSGSWGVLFVVRR